MLEVPTEVYYHYDRFPQESQVLQTFYQRRWACGRSRGITEG